MKKEFNHIYLDMHSDRCIHKSKEDNILNNYCELNPERVILFIKNQFIMLSYHGCLHHTHSLRYDFIKGIIEAIIKKSNTYELYEVNKSVQVNKELKEFRLRNKPLRKYIQEVNFIYTGFHKEYAITTKTKFIESFCDQNIIDKNFKIAREYLKNNNYEYLLEDLQKLYVNNKYSDYVEELEVIKTTEHLIKSLNKTIKNEK